MIYIAIYAITAFNFLTSFHILAKYSAEEKPLQLFFSITWISHYAIGNLLVLASKDLTYGYLPFDEMKFGYFLSLVVGQYFLWIYLGLLDIFDGTPKNYEPLRKDIFQYIVILLAISSMLAIMLVMQVGIGRYFSDELAQFRARLGDYSGVGIGVYYYLGTFFLPATILTGGYALTHPTRRNLLLFALALIGSLILYIPLGGRGRIVNVVFVLLLFVLISRRQFRISQLLTRRNILILVTVVVGAYFWGVVREGPMNEVSQDQTMVARGLAVDTTRLQFQAFIFERYPWSGVHWGTHYLESIAGPFYYLVDDKGAGLLRGLSAQWYYETVGDANIKSAISPSYIGEIYLNFGLLGVLLSPFLFFILIRISMIVGNASNPLALAVIIYFFQFNLFHGGLYSLFDMLLLTLPVLLFTKFLTQSGSTGQLPNPRVAKSAPNY